jgi:mlo protein
VDYNSRTNDWGRLKVILAVGTKLQGIITNMALEIKERHAVVQGIPLVQVSDRHFWFSWPRLVLYLIHFVLFQVLLSFLAPTLLQ